jgi:spore maturation protein SpmB
VLIAAILWFFALAAWKRIDAWASFIEGAGEGLLIVWQIAPYLVGMIVAVGQLRASGALDALAAALTPMLSFCGLPTDAANALPTMLMKPLSGSAARGLMVEVMHTQGPDSYAARLAGLFQGGTDTTFYVLALYSGAAGLKRLRHTLPCALIADLAGWIAAIFVATRLFH